MPEAVPEFDQVVMALRRELERQMQANQPRISYDNAVRAVLAKLQSLGFLTPLQEKRTGRLPPTEAQPGEIVRVTDQGPKGWPGVLAKVDRVSAWGIVAVARVPNATGFGDVAVRLEWGQFERLGVDA